MATPKLRFKEFEGDWVQSKLGTQAQFLQGEQVSLDDQYNEYTDGLTKFLRIENFTQKSKDFRYIKYIGSKEKLLNEQDIAIVRYGATAGFICSGETGVIANNLFKVIVDNKKINQKYLELVLKSEKTFNYFQSEMAGGAMPALNFKIVSNLDITYSSLEEQTKIASFLSAVDEKINQLTQKHALLSQYKQGMMQKLFSQQIRFKADDGSEFGEWDYLELNEVLDYEQPTKYIVKSTDYDSSYLTPVLTAGKTFILGYTNETSGIFEGDKENVIIFDDFTTAYKFVNFRFKVKSSAMKILKLNHFQNNIFYIYSVFSLLNLPLGDEHKRRWISEYSKQEIPVPCLEEQTKISNFLSAIDQKIEVVAQQIEQAKQWKKGLLQQMFV